MLTSEIWEFNIINRGSIPKTDHVYEETTHCGNEVSQKCAKKWKKVIKQKYPHHVQTQHEGKHFHSGRTTALLG